MNDLRVIQEACMILALAQVFKLSLSANTDLVWGCMLAGSMGTEIQFWQTMARSNNFIFGREGLAYFGGNTIVVKRQGFIAASGHESNDTGRYIFNQNTVILASDASRLSNKACLSCPWLVQVRAQSSFSTTSKALDKLISLSIKTTFPTVTAVDKGSNGAEFLAGKKDCAVYEW
ncbi:hypothetical protein BDQ17DRAFT_1332478 [Cyathus striatus]|nr:hypothetical protein BDQ17DRAFT_1332478 [Cyathus striatus]